MKTKNLFFVLFIILLTSCSSQKNYYQVYKTVPSDGLKVQDKKIVYEDTNCIIEYDFWSDGGNIGFRCYNKSNDDLFLNLDESFFVLNGIAHNYYKQRVFENSKKMDISSSKGVVASKSIFGINYLGYAQSNQVSAIINNESMFSSGFSVAVHEEKTVCIPSKTAKYITEYNVNKALFRDCNLLRYPKKKQYNTVSFSKSNTPFTFSNRISYTVGKSDSKIKFENEFYISEITNYAEKDVVGSKIDEFCGEKSGTKVEYFLNSSPEKFYIKYAKANEVKSFSH